jgi:hypothetical protein
MFSRLPGIFRKHSSLSGFFVIAGPDLLDLHLLHYILYEMIISQFAMGSGRSGRYS